MEQKKLTEQTAHIVQRAFNFNQNARKNGIAELKSSIDINRLSYRDVFEYGIQLCVNGVDSQRLDDILSNLVKLEQNEEIKRLKTIQKEAVLHIQKGFNSSLLLCKLLSYVKKDELDEVLGFISDSKTRMTAKSLLEKTYVKQEETEKTNDNCDNPTVESVISQKQLFKNIYNSDPSVLTDLLKQEQPQTVAFILAFLESKKAASILKKLSAGMQSDIAFRIATMDIPNLEILYDVLNIEKKILSVSGRNYSPFDSNEFKTLLETYLVNPRIINEAKEFYDKASEIKTGSSEAIRLIDHISSFIQGYPSDFLATNPGAFLGMLEQEKPKTIAYILAFLDSKKASIMLQHLPENLRFAAVYELAVMDNNHPDILRIGKKLSALFSKKCAVKGGVRKICKILIHVNYSTEESIFGYIEEKDPELAERIRNSSFVFNDLFLLNDEDIQNVLRTSEKNDIALVLKYSSPELQEKIFKNMSKRAAIMLKEDIECMKEADPKEIEEAKKNIITLVRYLSEIGDINTSPVYEYDQID